MSSKGSYEMGMKRGIILAGTAKEVAGAKDEDLVKVILEGKGKMPATKGLSKDEAKQVLEYTRSLSK